MPDRQANESIRIYRSFRCPAIALRTVRDQNGSFPARTEDITAAGLQCHDGRLRAFSDVIDFRCELHFTEDSPTGMVACPARSGGAPNRDGQALLRMHVALMRRDARPSQLSILRELA